MFTVKVLDIDSGDELHAIINQEVAEMLKVVGGDKIVVETKDKHTKLICDVEVDKTYTSHTIGLNSKAAAKLNQSAYSRGVMIYPAPKPKSIEYVRLKFENKIRLEHSHFLEILEDIINNSYSKVETTYFVLACSVHKLTDAEVIAFTQAMVDCGKHLEFSNVNRPIIVDKHCIGGVPNNRTTMLAIPLIIAGGLTIPKTSSRSITSPAGTADTMEVLANVELNLDDMYHIVKNVGGCLAWGGALDLSPADDMIIRVEHPLHIDTEDQMIASILSKKKSAGSTHVLIDIPYGPQTKVESLSKAKRLKKRFEVVGEAIGLTISVEITNGSQPIGFGVGPYFEALDVLAVLSNSPDAPKDLMEKALVLTGKIFELAKVCVKGKGYDLALKLLRSGRGFEVFEQIRKAQGYKQLPEFPTYGEEIIARHDGIVQGIKNKAISKLAFIVGAPTTPTAGLIIKKKVGDKIQKGDILFELYSESEVKIKYALEHLKDDFPYIY
ncbi:MAG: thymidine phosphorylase [Candidatus Woesearchaeota archaeon]